LADIPQWCDDVTGSSGPGRFARRSLLKAAVLGSGFTSSNENEPVYTITGTIIDASPHVLVLRTGDGERRFPLTATVRAWRGGPTSPAALREGDQVAARRSHPGGPAVDRIWAQVGRVTGTIIERHQPATLLVDEGPDKGRRVVVMSDEAADRIQVRFPRLEPGYLIDVIGLKHEGFVRALIPATSQPPYPAGNPPAPPLVSGHVPDPVSGTAVWHEPGEEPEDLLGLAYPALDPETGCAHPAEPRYPHAAGSGCVRLPYLSVGSLVLLRNDCAKRTRLLPVTGCGATARLFCDRCLTCGTSRKGRIADLTMAAFVELGGDLELGCFNATMTIGS
jgi:hypothetical protein